MEILILSKTRFGGNSVCVGGMVLGTNQYVRLLNEGGYYQYANTEFNIGDVWDVNFSTSHSLKPPHIEDVIIKQKKRLIRKIDNIPNLIKQLGLPIWRGDIKNIFDSKLSWTHNGGGFLSENTENYPTHSVGFWISDKPLKYSDEHYLYNTNSFIPKKLKYKGTLDPIDVIPENTLIRVSLAKWWKPNDSNIEERCYAQLSGWY